MLIVRPRAIRSTHLIVHQAANGLDIPTELSPMKEGEPMVPRSIFSSRTSSSFMR